MTNAEAGEIILEALSEGGSLTLLGVKTARGWRFRVVRDESTFFDILNDEDRKGMDFRHESEWMDSWKSALGSLNKYPWHKLHAHQVHPDFKRRIWAAAQYRFGRVRRLMHAVTAPEDAEWQQLKRWHRLCR